jgi:hypothetical protein
MQTGCSAGAQALLVSADSASANLVRSSVKTMRGCPPISSAGSPCSIGITGVLAGAPRRRRGTGASAWTSLLSEGITPCFIAFDDTDSWLRVGKAAALLGLDRHKIYPLLGNLLHYRRPLKALHLVSLESIKRLKAASQAKDFWRSPELQRPVRACVRQQMGKAIAPRLQPDES